MVTKNKIENRLTSKGLNSYFIINDTSYLEDENCNQSEGIFYQNTPSKDDTPNMSVETPKHKNFETPVTSEIHVQDVTARLIANKAFFMNEIYELKREILCLKTKVSNWESLNQSFDDNNIIKNLESQISLLQQENSIIKTELKNKQKTIESLLVYNNNQLITETSTKEVNQKNATLPKQQGKPSNDNSKHHIDIGKPNNNKNKVQSSNHITSKKKVTIVGDSILKYVRREDVSTKQHNTRVLFHLGATTEDMLDFVKPIVRRKPDYLLIHSGSNDLTKGVNTIKKVKKLTKVIRELDTDEEIKLGFSSITCRKDRDLDDKIKEVNDKLEKYCKSKGFIFVDNKNIDESCLNNSKLHLNKNGTNMLLRNFKRSLYQG